MERGSRMLMEDSQATRHNKIRGRTNNGEVR